MQRNGLPNILIAGFLLSTFLSISGAAEHQTTLSSKKICRLDDPRITESSGLAASLANPGMFWTHNDSGDRARLFLFDRQGKTRAVLEVDGAAAIDWEDLASFRKDGKNYLLAADIGDNKRLRGKILPGCTLYIVEEPQLNQAETSNSQSETIHTRPVARIRFLLPEGPYDCESVGVDAVGETILLATKRMNKSDRCRVLALPLTLQATRKPLIAREIVSLDLPTVSAMDVSLNSRQVVFLTQKRAFVFPRKKKEADHRTWTKAFQRAPEQINLPKRGNGESICFGTQGHFLYLTSEGKNSPLWEVPLGSE